MKKSKILVVEDDKSLVKIFEEALDHDKYEVILALSAEEGCARAIKDQPNLIILDVLLPGKSGFECLKHLKDNSQTKKIPVIILSNLGQDDEIRKGLELGADDYLVKADFSIDQIIQKIKKVIT